MACASDPVTALPCIRVNESSDCPAASVGEDDDKTALKTNGQGGTKLGKQKQKPAVEADDTPRKKGKK